MSVVSKILLAQSLVRKAESGETEWREIGDAVFDDQFSSSRSLYGFVADIYFRFRLTEAMVYHFRQGSAMIFPTSGRGT